MPRKAGKSGSAGGRRKRPCPGRDLAGGLPDGTPGSAGGPQKPTGGNPGRALRSDPTARAGWAVRHLHRGNLAVAHAYLVLHIDAATSLTRRADRLTPGHPWSNPAGLARAANFYTDPVAALAPVNPDLAGALLSAAWHHLTGASLDHTLRCLHDLAGRP